MKTPSYYWATFYAALTFVCSCSEANGTIDVPILTGNINDIENIQIFPANHPFKCVN